MREIFINNLLALMQGKKTCIKAVLTAENLELMFQIGREYGFVTVAMRVDGVSSTQVALHRTQPISMKISLKLIEGSAVEVRVKRISEKEYKDFIESSLN